MTKPDLCNLGAIRGEKYILAGVSYKVPTKGFHKSQILIEKKIIAAPESSLIQINMLFCPLLLSSFPINFPP